MAEEQKEPQQVTTKEPQQVTQVTKEPHRVTTKNPKKVEAGKRLAVHRCRRREEQRKEQVKLEKTASGVNQYYGIGAVIALGVYRWSWLLHLSNQERRATFIKPTTK